MTTISGRTAKATSASRQFIDSITIMIPASVKTSPKIETTPEVNRSLITSTSVVTRVISRPTGIAIVEAEVEALQVAVDLHAHVEHDPLPGRLQQPGLGELEAERPRPGSRGTRARSG